MRAAMRAATAQRLRPSRGVRSLALVIALGAVACKREEPVPIPSPFQRLADARARALGWREAPSAAIGETTRYVLAEPHRAPGKPLDAQTLARVQAAPIPYTVRCPPGEQRRRFVAALRGYSGASGDVSRPLMEVALRGRCPREGDGSRVVTFPRLTGPVDWARVDLVVLPPRTVTSDWIDLPEGAWLETAVGLFGERAPGTARGAEFAVRAENPAGATVLVAQGRLDAFTWSGQAENAVDPGAGWQPLSLGMHDARARLGPRIRLLFTARAKGRSSLVPVWGDPTLFLRRQRGDGRRRNVVLVSLDTLRADHLGVGGFPGDVSPHLDRLASEGASFTDAVALSNWTLPSHATMLTGVDPCVHGFRGALTGPGPRRLPPGVVPLAETLRQHGWVTAGFTENGYLLPVVFHRGFDRFDASKRAHIGVIEATFDAARTWLRGHAANEFFLFIHTYQVHAPYDPPEPYRSTFAGADANLPKAADAAAYAGEVAFTDAVVGRFLAEIDELGLRDRTIVIVTSDHGESFGEHGATGHGMSLHEEEVRVPFIWRAPGLVRAGARVDDLTSLVDLVPTVTEMLGLPAPPVITGLSLYGTMRVDAPHAPLPPSRSLIVEGMAGRSVRAHTWKTIFGGTIFQLLDLASDPRERSPKRLAHHAASETLLAEHAALCDRLRTRVGVPEEESSVPPIDPGLGERLRALGYAH